MEPPVTLFAQPWGLALLWLGATLGSTVILVRGTIFGPLRAAFPKKKGYAPVFYFGTIIHCPLCTGFHVAWFWFLTLLFALTDVRVSSWQDGVRLGICAFATACLGAAASHLSDLVYRKLGGTLVLKHERHPWMDVPEPDRLFVLAHLRAELVVYRRRVSEGTRGMSDEMSAPLVAEDKALASAYETALDLLTN